MFLNSGEDAASFLELLYLEKFLRITFSLVLILSSGSWLLVEHSLVDSLEPSDF